MATKKEEQNLPVVVQEMFPILSPDCIEEQSLVMQENLAAFGGRVSITDFSIIKVPKAPVTFWEREKVFGDKEALNELLLIPFKILTGRLLFPDGDDDSKVPPACYSTDGIHGSGNPGGLCASCPYDAFGSKKMDDGKQSKAKACREYAYIVGFTPGSMMPEAVRLPVMSIKPFKEFMKRLTTNGMAMSSIVAGLTLKSEGSGKTEYNVVVPRVVSKLNKAEFESVRKMRSKLEPLFEAIATETQRHWEANRKSPQNYGQPFAQDDQGFMEGNFGDE